MLCQARLTNYHKTKTKIGNQARWNATYLRLCENEAAPGTELCERCSKRPTAARNQITMIHGKLSEEIPYTSRIYGGKWYWDMVGKYGEPQDKEWIRCAQAAQLEGEKRAGLRAWKIPGVVLASAKQNEAKQDDAKQDEAATKSELKIKVPVEKEMPPAAAQQAKKDKGEAAAKKPRGRRPAKKKETQIQAQTTPLTPGTAGTGTPKSPDLRKHIHKITAYYEEAEAQPKKLPTDAMKIWKTVVDGKEVWRSEAGHLFAMDEAGEPGVFLGKC